MTQDDPEMEEMIRESYVNARIAQIIYEARTEAGLTQQQLADDINSCKTGLIWNTLCRITTFVCSIAQ
jgi:ribosome-binding protein aMBF1 (putative translation factor)